MRKLLIWSVALAAALGMAATATGYAGRQSKRMTAASTAVTHTRMGATTRITAVTVVYDKPTTNTLYVYATQDDVTSLRATVGRSQTRPRSCTHPRNCGCGGRIC